MRLPRRAKDSLPGTLRLRKAGLRTLEGGLQVKAHRQYVREQVKRDPRFAKDLEKARAEVRLAVMIARLREELGLLGENHIPPCQYSSNAIRLIVLVFYYTASNGRRPVEEFIRALPARLQAATLRAVERIAEQGIAAPGLSLRQVRGKLWEIRIQDGGAVRIFYVTRGAEGRAV